MNPALTKTPVNPDQVVLWTHQESECITLTINRTRGCIQLETSNGFFICSRKAKDDLVRELDKQLAILEAEEDVMRYL
jgi:hypothetical protein